ncbi:MAG: ABC transporter permease subunit [Oscillospiraceae bacterium]|nr:ABC transporter permease subunit [Oscillospiraceae bacterium]
MRGQAAKGRPIVLCHALFVLLLLSMYLPGLNNAKATPTAMTAACVMAEIMVIYQSIRGKNRRAAGDLGAVLFLALLAWQVLTTRMGLGHIILTPAPEAVFHVFYAQRVRMVTGIFSSLSLLAIGFAISLPLGTALGLLVGWNPRLRDSFVPLARVLSPIPAIIYAPYLIALMPSFRAASAAVLVIGIFWPTFLQMVARVGSLDKRVVDSAVVLGLSQRELLWEVFLPWLLPGVLTGLRSSLSSAFMLLTLAEMMGAHSGLGYFIKNFADYANYTNVLAGILLVALVITALNKLVGILEQKLVRWT